MKVIKTDDNISIVDFKDNEEQDIIYSKVKLLITEWESKRKVFG